MQILIFKTSIWEGLDPHQMSWGGGGGGGYVYKGEWAAMATKLKSVLSTLLDGGGGGGGLGHVLPS